MVGAAARAATSAGAILLALTATAQAAPSVIVDPTSVDFGATPVNAPGKRTVHLANQGMDAVDIVDVQPPLGDPVFSVDAPPLPLTLRAGDTADLVVTFDPMGAAAAFEGELQITTTAPDPRWIHIPLSGAGAQAGLTVAPNTMTFPEVLANSASGAQTVVVTNTGSGPLSAPVVSLAGADPAQFLVLPVAARSLGPGASLLYPVLYMPTAAGTHTASLVIAVDGLAPATVKLAGTAAGGAVLTASPAALTFGPVPVGAASPPQVVKLTAREGLAWLPRITSVTLSDPAIRVDWPARGLSRDQLGVLSFGVLLEPRRAGAVAGTIAIAFDGPRGGALTIPVTGEGVIGVVRKGDVPRAAAGCSMTGEPRASPLAMTLWVLAVLAIGRHARRDARWRGWRLGVGALCVTAFSTLACEQTPAAVTVATYTCTPPCSAGYVCTPDGCRNASGGDLGAFGAPDQLAGLDANPCARPAPFPVDAGCAACRADSDCPDGAVCLPIQGLGVCVPGCHQDARCGAGLPGQILRCCDGQCRDVGGYDSSSCGACGVACVVTFHRASDCQKGACTPGDCLTGWADCNQQAVDGCEIEVDVDPDNCTACRQRCMLPNARAACSRGCYIAACTAGFDDCDGLAANGCEVDLLLDKANCGACGNRCALNMVCNDGQCV